MFQVLSDFLKLARIDRSQVFFLCVVGILIGLAHWGLLFHISEAMRIADTRQVMIRFLLFIPLLGVYLIMQRFMIGRVSRLSVTGSENVRKRLIEAIYHAPISTNERIDHSRKLSALSQDAAVFLSALPTLVSLLSAAATSICALGYLFWLSPTGAGLVCGVLFAAIAVYNRLNRGVMKRLRAAFTEQDVFQRYLQELFEGSKELKLERRFAENFLLRDLFGSLTGSSRSLAKAKLSQQDVNLLSLAIFFILLASSAFLLPVFGSVGKTVAANFLFVLLFLQMPIQTMLIQMPAMTEIAAALERTRKLLNNYAIDSEHHLSVQQGIPDGWQEIRLAGTAFEYCNSTKEQPFSLRDINLTIARGSIVFIVGGNGSGKTTLAKVMMGLYRATAGKILVDDTPVDTGNLLSYRALFNAVFSDVHLFSREVEDSFLEGHGRTAYLLQKMKVDPARTPEGRLEVRALSQGQKKRLASVFALSDDKPIQFFDEWTADQDPEFRSYFYHEFLPELKREGKTVVVISHDDRFFDCADVIVKLDLGRITSVTRREESALPFENATISTNQLK